MAPIYRIPVRLPEDAGAEPGGPWPSVREALRLPTVVDTPLGHAPDAPLALWLAARLFRLSLVVTNDDHEGSSARLAVRLLRGLGREGIPVVAGPSSRGSQSRFLCGELIPASEPPLLGTTVLERLDAIAARHPDTPILWVVLGSATTLASVVSARPDLAARLIVVFRAGGFDGQHERPEHNIGLDVEAARTVLAAAPRLRSLRILLSDHTFHPRLRAGSGSLLYRALLREGADYELLRGCFDRWFANRRAEPVQAAAVAVAWLAGRPFVTAADTRFTLTADGVMRRDPDGEHSAYLSTEIDYDRFSAWLLTHVGSDFRYPAAAAVSAGEVSG